jgi:NAD(P)H-quinone oxidoreductase subunit 5
MIGNWTDIAFFFIPIAYLCTAAAAPSLAAASGWRLVQTGSAIALLLICTLPFLPDPASGWFLNDPMHLVVQGLVAFIGLIVARYSARYLEGDVGQRRFQRWLQLTLGCVMVVATTNHLAVFIAAWVGISLSLHQLLMFYPERKRAALAAHKKFLFARLAESCLIGAAALLFIEHGTLFISVIMSDFSGPGVALTGLEQIAALLIASAAMVKCAQFPMHGWLIQVVEAPTPVSALLHAGVINLGGFLLLLMAPLMLHAELANWLILIVAGLTCIAAALITMTRVSVKVLLAWSTVAQMGLMLVECALGQYGLALLHLVAHSCYKAYAFLAAGSEVENYLRRQLAPPRMPAPATLPIVFAIAVLAIAVAIAMGYLGTDASLWLLLALLPVVMMSERGSLQQSGSLAAVSAAALLLVGAYAIQKYLFIGLAPEGYLPSTAQALWCATLFTVLLAAYWILRQRGDSGLGRGLYRNLYAGFYLDEWATRATLALWPANLPERAGGRRNAVFQNTEELS